MYDAINHHGMFAVLSEILFLTFYTLHWATVQKIMATNVISVQNVQIQRRGVSRQVWQDKADHLNIASITRNWDSQTEDCWNLQWQALVPVVRPRQLEYRLKDSNNILIYVYCIVSVVV